MSISWLTITPSIIKGIAHINEAPQEKFTSLLEHIHKNNLLQQDEPFTKEEIEKLQRTFQQNHEEFDEMITTVLEIMKKSNKFLMKPTDLQEDLTEKLSISLEKAEVFVKFWTLRAHEEMPNLHERQEYCNMSWQTRLRIPTGSITNKPVPVGLVHIKLKNNKDENEMVSFEMNDEQLLKLYNDIEEIQNTLDNMNK